MFNESLVALWSDNFVKLCPSCASSHSRCKASNYQEIWDSVTCGQTGPYIGSSCFFKSVSLIDYQHYFRKFGEQWRKSTNRVLQKQLVSATSVLRWDSILEQARQKKSPNMWSPFKRVCPSIANFQKLACGLQATINSKFSVWMTLCIIDLCTRLYNIPDTGEICSILPSDHMRLVLIDPL